VAALRATTATKITTWQSSQIHHEKIRVWARKARPNPDFFVKLAKS
jgi:hypothetical protein